MHAPRTSRALIGTLLALFFLPAGLFGGQQGRITGKVTDGKGVALADVKIVVTTKALTNFKQELKTDKDGKWATFLNDATAIYHYHFEKPGYVAVEKDKKVPLWNPNDDVMLGQRSADLSVLNIRLVAEARAARNGK